MAPGHNLDEGIDWDMGWGSLVFVMWGDGDGTRDGFGISVAEPELDSG